MASFNLEPACNYQFCPPTSVVVRIEKDRWTVVKASKLMAKPFFVPLELPPEFEPELMRVDYTGNLVTIGYYQMGCNGVELPLNVGPGVHLPPRKESEIIEPFYQLAPPSPTKKEEDPVKIW
uniref:Uncharacterized protein n=1 Tax=Romanomermis culicivorax TaxID=13658 RepID=A0A915I1V5_ROMCU